jgi:hypothetical protein
MDINSPVNGFKSFLDRAEEDGWIASYRWTKAETFGLLKIKLGGPAKEGFSRSHKRGTDGIWYALEVESHYGTSVGVDLELLMPRPILDNPEWILRRLGMTRTGSPRAIIEEWSAREAAFKALSTDNVKIVMSQFRRTAPNTLTVLSQGGDHAVQTRTSWSSKWVVSLAWRTLS